ncbi:MAG: hypothetical protein E7562_02055 [Ruminococcaceae bacterium]|nr:hypothetical protein [Oscillospiraceae bacterium]
MTKTLKKILGVFLAVTMIASLVAVPTAVSAETAVAKGEYTVQEWDFDSEYTASYEAADKVTFLDDNEIAIANKNWHDSSAAPTARTIKNGVLKIELKTSSNSKNFSTTNLALRLDTTLKAGKEYTFKLGMYSPDKIWSYKTYIMYSDAASLNNTGFANYVANKSSTPSVDSEANFGIGTHTTKLNVTQIGSLTDTYKTHTFAFTPETDITAGNYIRVALNFRNTAADTVKTVYVDEMMIKAGSADVEVPANEQMVDENGRLKVQSWQFNSTYSNAELQAGTADVVTFLDENEIAIAYKNWHDNTAAPTTRTIENGVLKLEIAKNSATKYFSTTNIALRLDQTLIAGQAYKFQIGMYSPDKIWSYKTYIMSSNSTLNTTTFTPYLANKAGPSVDNEANFGIGEYTTKLNVRQIGSLTDTNKVHEFTFVPETDISAGDYIRVALNFQNTADAVKTVYVTSLDLLAVNPNLAQKDETGKFYVQDWEFDSAYTASYLAKDNVTLLDEDEIAIANKNWHDDTAAPTARTVKDGVMKIELKTSSNSSYFSTTNVALRLDHTLKAGTEYTFQLGMYSPDEIWSYKTYIMYSDAASLNNTGFANYVANKAGPSVDTEANFGIGEYTTKLNVKQIGSLTDTEKVYDFTFTPEEDVTAGNYIRVALNFRNTDADTVKTVYVTSFGLKASANEYLDEYIFTDEGSRERVWENAEEIEDGAYKRSGQNMIVVLKDEYLKANTEYTAMLSAAVTYEGAYLDVYAFGEKPVDYEGKDEYDTYYNNLENAKLIQQNVVWINNITNGDTSTRFTIKAVFTTSGTDTDYNEYKYLAFVIRNKKNADGNVNWSNQIFLDEIMLYSTVKGYAPEGMRETVVINSYAKKLKVESDRFARYYLKNADGSYTELSSTADAITGLTPDTEYTVVTKWIDDGRFYASEGYGEEFTFKTLKYGDVNRDNDVDVIDLVAQKKAAVASSNDEIFDMDDDGSFSADDIVKMRKVLLNIVD